jgi:hypothetical protein
MAAAIYPAMFFTVAMLVTTAYFILGGLPLLILQHDTPVDARFVRSFFNVYYKAAMVAAVGACISFALWGRPGFALACALLAVVAVALRRVLLPLMQQHEADIQRAGASAVDRFRRVHGAALLFNVGQLVAIVWGITKLSL